MGVSGEVRRMRPKGNVAVSLSVESMVGAMAAPVSAVEAGSPTLLPVPPGSNSTASTLSGVDSGRWMAFSRVVSSA